MVGSRGNETAGKPRPADCRDPVKRRTLKRLAALGLLAATDLGALCSCGHRAMSAAGREQRLILLGIDGLDARIAEGMMARGELPTLRRLREAGGYCRLRSTIPPQSPSAWATLITGLDPGGHGICDFVERDPQTYALVNSIAATAPPRHALTVGEWRLPLTASTAVLKREGRAFWDLLTEAGVPCDVYRVPSNFPPADSGARQLAGMGVPDARGTLGTYSYYEEGVASQTIAVVDGRVRARLPGPPNSLRQGRPQASVDFDVYLDRASRVGKVVIQGTQVLLRQGEWSGWVPVRFTLLPHLKAVAGICRFYLKEIAPTFRLYVTPVHFDPMEPALPIGSPRGYARELAEQHGRFHTLGLPEDTTALDMGVLSDADYLHQAAGLLGELRGMWGSALNQFDRGMLFYYFGTTDRAQHMFWRTHDPRHPGYRAPGAQEFRSVVEDCYRLGDELAGEALEAADERTTVVILSDHGFAPMYRKFHLNAWLAERGYLALRYRPTPDLMHGADWGRTTAYGVGLNSLYLNLQGREGQGIVSAQTRQPLVERLARELREARDPETGELIFAGVYPTYEAYRSRLPDRTPDIIVGYASGYRGSASSALGKVSADVVKANTGKWSGDHCIDVRAVPGVVFSNRRIEKGLAALADITATVLREFGVGRPREIQGRPIWS